jgi:hypothetical protein
MRARLNACIDPLGWERRIEVEGLAVCLVTSRSEEISSDEGHIGIIMCMPTYHDDTVLVVLQTGNGSKRARSARDEHREKERL